MKKNNLVLILILSLSQFNCAFARRHPTQTKIYVIGAGALIGGSIALSQRRGICQGVYESQNYYGTAPCPVGTIITRKK